MKKTGGGKPLRVTTQIFCKTNQIWITKLIFVKTLGAKKSKLSPVQAPHTEKCCGCPYLGHRS